MKKRFAQVGWILSLLAVWVMTAAGAPTITKRLIYMEDLKTGYGIDNVPTSTGGSMSVTRIHQEAIPFADNTYPYPLPYVDARRFMDGVDGRPTLAAWVLDQANGNSPTVDTVKAIQAAVDNALQSHISKVFLADGMWKTTGPIHLGYGESYRQVILEGAGRAFMCDVAFPGTIIDASSFSNAPAIVIQGGRSSAVKKMSIKGASYRYMTDTFYTLFHSQTLSYTQVSNPASWVSGITANGMTRYAPYAGVAIDPYCGSRPGTSYPDVTYPAWTGIGSTQYGKNHSSQSTVEDVEFNGFYVDVVVNPSAEDGNGDFTKIIRCNLMDSAYGVSVGQTQSRNVSIQNTEFANMHTLITNNKHGIQAGTLNSNIVNVSGGQVFQIFDITHTGGAGPLYFENFYAEELVRLGYGGGATSVNSGIVFESSQISYFGLVNGPVTGRVYNVPIYEGWSPLTFRNSQLFGSFPLMLLSSLSTAPVRVEDSTWRTFGGDGEIYAITDNNQKLAYNWMAGGLANLNGSLSGTLMVSSFTGLPDPTPKGPPFKYTDTVEGISNAREMVHSYSRWVKYPGGARVSLQQVGIDGNQSIAKASLTSPLFDDSTLLLTFTYSGTVQANYNVLRLEPGSILIDLTSKALFVIDNVTANAADWDVSATMVTNYWIDNTSTYNVITEVDPAEASGYFYLYQTFHKPTYQQFRGNIVSGSDNVTNVHNSQGTTSGVPTYFKVGDLMFNNHNMFDNYFPPATKIIATGDGWIQLDTNVTHDNAVNVPIELYR